MGRADGGGGGGPAGAEFRARGGRWVRQRGSGSGGRVGSELGPVPRGSGRVQVRSRERSLVRADGRARGSHRPRGFLGAAEPETESLREGGGKVGDARDHPAFQGPRLRGHGLESQHWSPRPGLHGPGSQVRGHGPGVMRGGPWLGVTAVGPTSPTCVLPTPPLL